MAEDIREAILARLAVVLGELVGIDSVKRNLSVDDDAGDSRRIVILEGDEIPPEQEPNNKPATAPHTIYMHPQIELRNFADASDVGPNLSAMRGLVITAIATDATLTGYTVKGLGGRYIGMESDLMFARAMSGTVALKFQFAYTLRPDQF
jgi:hypothetical protein